MYKKLIVTLFLILSTKLLAQEKGKELFGNNCAFCHHMSDLKSNEDSLAPTLSELSKQLRQKYETDKKILSHIKSFVFNPKEEKADTHNVLQFGLMPSQEEILSKKDLNIIAKWIVKISK